MERRRNLRLFGPQDIRSPYSPHGTGSDSHQDIRSSLYSRQDTSSYHETEMNANLPEREKADDPGP